jgi:ASC-1-like (ASCH) protein
MSIKQQADSYVEMFYQFPLDKIECTRCAIIHVEGIMIAFSKLLDRFEDNHYGNVYTNIEIVNYNKVLEELKSRI